MMSSSFNGIILKFEPQNDGCVAGLESAESVILYLISMSLGRNCWDWDCTEGKSVAISWQITDSSLNVLIVFTPPVLAN